MVINWMLVICFSSNKILVNFCDCFLPGKKLESSSVVLVFYHTSYIICQTSTATRTLESSSVTTKKTSRVLCPRNCPYPPPPPPPPLLPPQPLVESLWKKLESGVKQRWKFNFNLYKDPPPPLPPWGEGGKGMDKVL